MLPASVEPLAMMKMAGWHPFRKSLELIPWRALSTPLGAARAIVLKAASERKYFMFDR